MMVETYTRKNEDSYNFSERETVIPNELLKLIGGSQKQTLPRTINYVRTSLSHASGKVSHILGAACDRLRRILQKPGNCQVS